MNSPRQQQKPSPWSLQRSKFKLPPTIPLKRGALAHNHLLSRMLKIRVRQHAVGGRPLDKLLNIPPAESTIVNAGIIDPSGEIERVAASSLSFGRGHIATNPT